MKLKHVFALAAVFTAAALGAKADQLADIKAKGQLVCGTLGTAEPFSFQDPKTRDIVGYDVDMCRKVAEALGVKLEIKPISVEARIPELTQGRVDILAANLGYTKERAQQIDYSYSYFVSLQKLIVTKESGITTFDQLAGKKITATKGSTSEQGVRRLIPKADVVTFADQSGAFLALTQDKVDAFCASELNLVKLEKQSTAVPLAILKQTLFPEPWGLGLRKGEAGFKEAVNKVLSDLDKSGEADKIFAKWFGPETIYNIKRDFKIEDIKD